MAVRGKYAKFNQSCLLVSLYVCLSVCMYVRLSVCVSVCVSVCMFVCMFDCVFVCPSVCQSICLFVCLSVCLSICPCVCLIYPILALLPPTLLPTFPLSLSHSSLPHPHLPTCFSCSYYTLTSTPPLPPPLPCRSGRSRA